MEPLDGRVEALFRKRKKGAPVEAAQELTFVSAEEIMCASLHPAYT